jgi:hypothetical protein
MIAETSAEEVVLPGLSAGSPLSDAKLNLQKTVFPLGFPVEIFSNSVEVLDAAADSWGHSTGRVSNPACRLHVRVSRSDRPTNPQPPTYRSQEGFLAIVADAENFAMCDLGKGFAFICLTSTAIKDRAFVRYFFLEAAVMCLLSALRVTAVHAACVEFAGRGFLFCGKSGAGKSSLAFACARSGWTYISDDASYVVQNRSDRLVLGNSRQIRFRPSASALFPELERIGITPRAAGKPSIEVPISSLRNDISTATESKIDYVISLNRDSFGTPELVSVSKDAVREKLEFALFGTPEMQVNQATTLDHLLGAKVFELRYRDLNWAKTRLESLAQERQ